MRWSPAGVDLYRRQAILSRRCGVDRIATLNATALSGFAMLDIDLIRKDPAAVKANVANRNVTADVDRILALDDERKRLLSEQQTLQQKANDNAKRTGPEKDPAVKQQLIAEGKALREQVTALEKRIKQVIEERDAALATLPNMTHPDAPVGKTSESNRVIRRWGEPRKFDFKPKDHVALCEALDLADFEAGASVAGQKFYFLKNEAVLLELALVQYAMQTLLKAGSTPVTPPDPPRVEVLEGTGFMPRAPTPKPRQVYTVADTDLCLVGTAEITLGGMHRNHTFDAPQL